MGEMLREVVELLGRGELNHSPIATWDVRRAPEAFRHLREGKNVGKVVFEIPQPIAPEKTVLITGGTGTLGSLAAKHLADQHGVRHMLLISRRGEEAAGAGALLEELAALGVEARIAACDVSDRQQVEGLLDSVPEEHPVGAIFHVAGALDDGTIDSLTPERLDPVFAPKADAAWMLHELTRELDLSAFVVFSSAAGTLGGPGQGNYAAANAFCDALASRRHAQGLTAASVAWGYWETESELTAGLSEIDLARMRRFGIAPLSDEQGLALLDQALAAERPTSLGIGLDPTGLRTAASAGALPPVFSEMVRAPKRRSAAAGSLPKRLATLPEDLREAAVLEAVRAEVAAVLGHPTGAAIEPDRPFQDLGFDSLAAVELRNRLSDISGARLAATVVFDHPNCAVLAKHVYAQIDPGGAAEAGPRLDAFEGELNRLESLLAQIDSTEARDSATARLRQILAGLEIDEERPVDADVTDEEMFALLDKKLGEV